MSQINPIDIHDWPKPLEFSEAYPEGARPKRIILSPPDPVQNFIKPDWQYMFKLSSNRSSEQFWCEAIAYEIGVMLDIPVPPSYAAYDSMTGQCGALIEWFFDSEEKSFHSAGHFFHTEIPNFDTRKGTEHNLLTAQELNNRHIGDSQIYDFWSMMLFDTIIGNTDRHQDNWGYIVDIVENPKSVARRRKESHTVKLSFAPWFDNGTSLGYEIPEKKYSQWRDETFTNYIMRGKHHIRFAPDNLIQVGHIESIRFISKHNALVRPLLIRRAKRIDFVKLAHILDCFVDIPMIGTGRLTRSRADFILRLTQHRVNMTLDILNEHN